jgi:hypothetical protein
MPSIARFIRRVRLQNPAHLAALLRGVLGSVEVHLVEASGDAGVLVGGLDAEREDAHRVDLLFLAQICEPSEGQ